MSRYTHIGRAVATTKSAGNILAAALAVEPGDATAFDNAIPLYAIGTTHTDAVDGPLRIKIPSAPPAAWFIEVLMTTEKAAEADQLIAAGLPPGVNAACHVRGTEAGEWLSWLGYELTPRA